jgi:hypothetical protein
VPIHWHHSQHGWLSGGTLSVSTCFIFFLSQLIQLSSLRVPGLTQALGVWLSLEGSYGPHSHRLLDDTHVGAAMESEVSSASTVMNPLSPQQRARLLSSAVGARRIADEVIHL